MPTVYYAPYGTNYITEAEPAGGNCGRFPLGTRMELPDGRTYRYALAGSLARVAGKLYQSAAPVAAHLETVVSTVPAVGDKTIASTLGGTLAAIDIYSEGTAHVNKSAGLDTNYRIKRAIANSQAHAAVAASAAITVNLESGETVKVAGDANTEISYTRNRFHSTVICPTTKTAAISGAANWAATAAQYYFEQTKGYCPITTDGSVAVLVIGDICVPSDAVAGTVNRAATFETKGPIVGVVSRVNIDLETSLIDLKLDR